jgi:hypothetical protein
MSERIVIQNLQVESGSKKLGYIAAAKTPSSVVQMPIMIINGAKKGPKLSVTAGVHGCEYTGIVGLGRLFRSVDPKNVSGAVIAAPVVNVPSFENRTPYVCPVDMQNLNRIFPGRPDGTVGFQLAHTAFNEVISRCNYHIDLHGGDMGEEHIDVAYFSRIGNPDLDKKSEALARNCLAEWVWEHSPPTKGSTVGSALEKGIAAITYEVGDLARLEESRVRLVHDGILNIMRYLGMLPGEVMKSKSRDLDQRMMARAQNGGIFFPKVKQGDIVSKGQPLGEILNLAGEVVEKISSPADGVVLQTFPTSAVYSGASLVGVASFR